MKETALRVDSIKINERVNPLGIDDRQPVFHYSASSFGKGKFITALRTWVWNDCGIAWDSGKINADPMPYLRYGGKPLQPRKRYHVRMQLWDEQDIPGPRSETFWFEMGLMEDGFAADWIEPQQENAVREKDIPYFMVFRSEPSHYGGHDRCRPAQDIRRTFQLEAPVKSARVYASAHGIYELYINGNKAGSTSFAPEISTYQRYLYYQTYDITSLLRIGENVIAATLADGWWIGRIGLAGTSCQYGDRLGMILQLEAEMEDGSQFRLTSDENFRGHESAIRYADLFMGEKRDNGLEISGWNEPGFPDENWEICRFAAYNKGNLIAQPLDAVEDFQQLQPESWFETPRGELMVDFGQIVSGTIELTVNGAQGQEITLDFCEVLDEDGNFFRNIAGRNKDQTDVLVCREGRQTWRPRFTYHGFRYVRLCGVNRADIAAIRAIVLATRLEIIGSFECSDEKLNQLQHNIVWSEITNMLSIPTDCPQREKSGWAGDVQVFAKTGAFNLNLNGFLSAWMMNLRAEQKSDGAVPVIVPCFPGQEIMIRQIGGGVTSSGWSDACVLLPWYLYQCYGDIEILRVNKECMAQYLAYVKQQAAGLPEHYAKLSAEAKQRSPYLWNKGYHYGDWLIPSQQRLPNGIAEGRSKTREVVGSTWYAITVETYGYVLRALQEQDGWNLQAEIAANELLLRRIRHAIREEFVQKDGTISGAQMQGLYVMLLRSGAVEGVMRRRVAKKLTDLIEANGNCLDTGFSSVSFLLDVLTTNGRKDLAWKLLFQKSSPSWLYMVEHGATTIWENWEAITPEGKVTASSYNHYAFGCVGDWIYRNIGGIKPLSPGYKEIEFSPDFSCGLTSARCSHQTPFGRVSSEWQLSGKNCTVQLEVPVNTTARFLVGNTTLRLDSGFHYFDLILP